MTWLVGFPLCSVGCFGQFVQKVQERLALSDKEPIFPEKLDRGLGSGLFS
jgi:hypothetical protein